MNVNLLNEYKKQLKEKEKLALEKAEEILGDSFEIEKSIGFINWKKTLQNSPLQNSPLQSSPLPIKFKPKSKKI